MKVAPQARGRVRARAEAFAVSLIPGGYGWELPAFGISLKRDAPAYSCSGITYDLSDGR